MDRCVLSLLLFSSLLPTLRAQATVSFRNEVMAVLSRAGCNSGACHGNLNGKGGFRLSLRGEKPDLDHLTLTRDMLGRRIDRQRPADSLLLAKALMVQPHEGGQRFSRDGLEHRILARWIAEGARLDSDATPHPVRLKVTPAAQILHAPADRVTLTVRATFSDGIVRDVTRLACFEPSSLLVRIDGQGQTTRLDFGETAILVRYLDQQAVARLTFVPERPGFVWREVPADNFIDRHVFAKLKSLRLQPAERATDSEFLRRAYLDALGILPTPAETRRFLADNRPDRRDHLIDALLARNEFADFWALKWADLLRNEEKVLDARGVQRFHAWIRQCLVDRMPLNEFARALVAGRGSTYQNPPANFYRALRDPHTRAEAVAQVFLGTRLQCAKCHNHPFDTWTQTDYHRFSAFFGRIDYRIVENQRRDKLDKHEFDGEQIVYQRRSGEMTHPVTGEVLVPRFLGSEVPHEATGDRLSILADWIARPDNLLFARAQANRIWQHLMGRGLVDPGDDFRASNPPSHPELLDELARELIQSRYDLRHLVRMIMTSRTYQLSSVADADSADDELNYSHALVRPLQAEQLLDAVAALTGVRPRFEGFPRGTRAGQLPGVGANRRRGKAASESEKFLAVFGKPIRSLSCECERSDDTTLARSFQLLTGPLVQRLVSEPNNRISRLLDAGKSDGEILDELYLAGLCRHPAPAERQRLLAFVSKAPDRRAALEDVLWGLINAKEFLLRR